LRDGNNKRIDLEHDALNRRKKAEVMMLPHNNFTFYQECIKRTIEKVLRNSYEKNRKLTV